jgi:hypothetical protein
MTAQCLGEKEFARAVLGVREGGEMEMRVDILLSDEEMGFVPFLGDAYYFDYHETASVAYVHPCILGDWDLERRRLSHL